MRATAIDGAMEVAAAYAIAAAIPLEELAADYVIPSVFDRTVAPAVAEAVADAGRLSGLARL